MVERGRTVRARVVEKNGNKVPRKFIKQLEEIGISMMTGRAIYISNCEVVAVSPMWDEFVEVLQHVKDIAVDVEWAFRSRPDEPLYDPSDDDDHLTELRNLMVSHSSASGFFEKSLRYWDAATDIPTLVRAMVDPPAQSCPVAHAAPDGAYLMSIRLMFENVWFCIRINRKRNFV